MESTRSPVVVDNHKQASKPNPAILSNLMSHREERPHLTCDVWCLESTTFCLCVSVCVYLCLCVCVCAWGVPASSDQKHTATLLSSQVVKWPPAFRPFIVPVRSNRHVHISLFAVTLHMHSVHAQWCLHSNQDTSWPPISQLQTSSKMLSRSFCFEIFVRLCWKSDTCCLEAPS